VSRVLTIEALDAGYEGAAVVRGLDLTVDAGEVVALLGPNGAGKSTTLQTVSGLLPAIAGHVEVLGRSPEVRAPHRVARGGVAHVPEDRALFFDLTARQNLHLAGRRRRRAAAVERATATFPELSPLLDRRAGLLSGGQQQMLALARALVAEPRLLLVDELSLGLAPIVVQRLLPFVRRLADETGAGVLLVEQHLAMALEVADTVCLLVRGEVALRAPAAELRRDPTRLESAYLG